LVLRFIKCISVIYIIKLVLKHNISVPSRQSVALYFLYLSCRISFSVFVATNKTNSFFCLIIELYILSYYRVIYLKAYLL